MLPGHRRIRRAEEFRAVIRTGVRASSKTVVVHVGRHPLDDRDPAAGRSEPRSARAGFVVGKSVGGSVVRHRVVRRLRHLMAIEFERLPDGLDVVVRALPASAGGTADVLARDLSSALRRCLSALGPVPEPVRVVSR